MCFKSGLRAAALAGALMQSGLALAQAAGGFGGGHPGGGGPPPPSALPGVGAGAYAPGQGPTGAAGWNGGSWRGYTNAFGPFWGGGYSGYGGGDSGGSAGAGVSANILTYNHFDNRRRDGGFYGGGGVFYGDDGYSRLTPARAPEGEESQPHKAADEAAGVERPSANIIYLPVENQRPARGGARREVRH
ncbi:MAG: hypothetical protein EKK29_17755 [Hyphomicrobiales bacterium]|jgi:hypothetical protein|nr:MAG: hypothetical protein EKK29_17755 [Hyphomicrobiales bacterium]